MPRPRKTLISLDATPYYHCVSRCVRHAFLCGTEPDGKTCYDHRRGWVEERLLQLSRTFAIDVCAYAVMSNHTHAVLFVDKATADAWTLNEIIDRWHGLFAGTPLSQRYLSGERLHEAELAELREIAETWRERLTSISWFMRCLNEHIARRANAEDHCTGRFWEGRFKSHALLDEAALAACMAYVDLNPIRAGIAKTPETSDHTSIQRRIRHLALPLTADNPQPFQPPELAPFVGDPRQDMPKGLPFRFHDYLELVDWTGRILRDDKPGHIPENTPPILQRLGVKPDNWQKLTQGFEAEFRQWIGNPEAVHQACTRTGARWAWDTSRCRAMFSPC